MIATAAVVGDERLRRKPASAIADAQRELAAVIVMQRAVSAWDGRKPGDSPGLVGAGGAVGQARIAAQTAFCAKTDASSAAAPPGVNDQRRINRDGSTIATALINQPGSAKLSYTAVRSILAAPPLDHAWCWLGPGIAVRHRGSTCRRIKLANQHTLGREQPQLSEATRDEVT
jgi:hypothetical protein